MFGLKNLFAKGSKKQLVADGKVLEMHSAVVLRSTGARGIITGWKTPEEDGGAGMITIKIDSIQADYPPIAIGARWVDVKPDK
ncbi:MAG: hypothetical protein RBQ99_07105 [Trichlorobacter sp.]|nr:hypothetical protein [Trichlorobacter sp.]